MTRCLWDYQGPEMQSIFEHSVKIVYEINEYPSRCIELWQFPDVMEYFVAGGPPNTRELVSLDATPYEMAYT